MPNRPPKPSEIAVMLALMAQATEVDNTELQARYGFSLTGEARRYLNDEKLVASRKAGRSFRHELTDTGWARCREELAAPTPPRAGAAGAALSAVLHGLDRYLNRAQLSLADVFCPDQSTVDDEPEAVVRAAYAGAPRRPGGWVGLTELRARLGSMPRAVVDDTLIRMNRMPGVNLLPEENQKVLTDADRDAAVTLHGRPYHFLWIEQ
jgi:hypothetical protein